MRKLNRVSKIAAIGFVALVLIASAGVYAYWSAQKQITGNTIGSGHLGITVNDGIGQAAAAIAVSGLMPGQGNSGNPAVYEILSTAGNPNTDLIFSVSNVADTVSLADNVKVAFMLCTAPSGGFWLTPSGSQTFVDGQDQGDNWKPYAYNISAYNGKFWKNLPGYTNIVATDHRHIKVFYYLPLDCAADCHDDSVSFDMTFELEQSH